MSISPVLIVGSVALDSVETPSGATQRALGGVAVYSSVSASFFAAVRLVGVVGEDLPNDHNAFLQYKDLDTQGLQIIPGGRTFHWAGTYEGDMNQANTLATELNVFENFRPELPDAYKTSEFVFLANIDPELQLKVLEQVPNAKLTAMDTMNFWITGKNEALREVISRVDVIFINDAEIRLLTGITNLHKAAAEVRKMGPKYVIVKKGEHGAVMYCNDQMYFAAASYPIEEVADPTGAGDSFAGGFMGYVASSGHLSHENIRRAVIYGSTMASYNVQEFSLNRFKRLTNPEIASRYEEFRQIVWVE